MKMTKEEFIDLLIKEAGENGIKLNDEQAEKLWEYKNILVEWNEKINLTAITDDKEIITKHFIDSLTIVKHLENREKIIDVGTGAGFPGIVIAIYFEDKKKITLLDSLHKRTIFLEDCIKRLNLKNISVINGRAEEIAHEAEYREKFDVSTARAVAPLNILLEYLSGYVCVGGKCICMKASSAEQEIENAKAAIAKLNLDLELIERNIIKGNEEIERNIIVFNKNQCLQDGYPRPFGKIKKRPL